MILQSLVKMARRDGLVENPAFQSVPVRWVVTLDADGHFQTLDCTDYTPPAEGKRKPREQFARFTVPRRRVRSGMATMPDFLVDNIQYVFGMQSPTEKPLKIPLDCYRRKFVERIREANKAVSSSSLSAVVSFFANDLEFERAASLMKTQQFFSKELVVFRVHDEFVHDDPLIRRWWSEQNSSPQKGQEKAQCLVCGKRTESVRLHDQLKLPGTGAGAPLVGFNKDAFYKHGLIGNANAPVCRDCMVAYVNGLRRCLEENYPKPNSKESFRKQSTRLSDDTVAVYWDDESSPVSGLLALLNGDNPGQVKSLFEAAWKGLRPGAANERFYCLLLTGAQGRASVRGMHTSTLAGVKDSLFGNEQRPGYFACIESAVGTEKPAPVSTLLASLALPGKSAQLPSCLGEELFLNAILAQPLSQFFLTTAVTRTRAERKVSWPRAALLQLYFQRTLKPGMRKPPMSLDVNEPDAAYRYGRLLAVLEDLQIRYHNNRKPNSTIVDRFYASASTRPATAFPRLLTLAQNHLRTVPYSELYSRNIEEILGGLPGAQGFKSSLSLPEQGRFALGFFQQKNEIFRKKTERSTKNGTAETASNESEEKSATEEEEK